MAADPGTEMAALLYGVAGSQRLTCRGSHSGHARTVERAVLGRAFRWASHSACSPVLSWPARQRRTQAFHVPAQGRYVLLVVRAPRLRLLGRQRVTVHVPADADSKPVMFELRADTPVPVWVGSGWAQA